MRLIRLLDTPQAIPVIRPGILREIGYWLLAGPHVGEVGKIALPNGPVQRIAEALTSLTPLRYQKPRHLLEARRLMLAGPANVVGPAYR